MTRFLHIAVSFAIVSTLYWVYSVAAVPWIEPSLKLSAVDPIPVDRDKMKERISEQTRDHADLFEPDAWERKNPKVLDSGRFRLMMQDYRNLGDGRVELTPCTIIVWPNEEIADQKQRQREAVVLQAPEGALLEFDKSFNLTSGKVGRLNGGQLKGRITLRSEGKLPGPEDNLWIVTRDVELTEQHVWTRHAVDFRYGRHYGRGRQMHIKLIVDEPKIGAAKASNIRGMELFEMGQVERLHIELGKNDPKPAEKTVPAAGQAGRLTKQVTRQHALKTPAKSPAKVTDSMADLPIEITCKGPFRFNVLGKLATFEDQVDLMRIHPNGPADQLRCDRLSMFLVERKKPGPKKPSPKKPQKKPGKKKPVRKATTAAKDDPTAAFDLQAQKIIAQGTPVVVTVPSENLEARGQRLEYDLVAQRILLDGFREVMLRHGNNEIHAQSLKHETVAGSQLGRIEAKGPGWLRGSMDDKPKEQLEARWNDSLRVQPDRQKQLISLTGGASLHYSSIGQLSAREIRFWLKELPQKKKGQARLEPDRMVARDDVRITSAQLSCAVEEFEVLFQQIRQKLPPRQTPLSQREATLSPATRHYVAKVPPDPRSSGDRAANGAVRQAAWQVASRSPQLTPKQVAPQTSQPTATPHFFPQNSVYATQPQPAATPVGAPPGGLAPVRRTVQPTHAPHPATPPKQDANAGPQQHFEVVGRKLRAHVRIYENRQSELSELIVEEGVQFVETQTAKPGERPLRVYGDQLHVVNAQRPHAAVTVVGSPAHFDGRGLGLTGPSIHLNRGTNRLVVEGAGRMDVPMNRDLEGKNLVKPGTMTIQWGKRMEFDGLVARFHDGVTALGPSQQLQTDNLAVQFREMVRFTNDKFEKKPEIEVVTCNGGVLFKNRTLENNRQTSYDRIHVADLQINLITGAIGANGPGWVTSVRLGNADFANPTTQTTATQTTAEELRCLHVKFQRSLTGNLHQREMTFHHRVQTAYGPADSWETTLNVNDPDSLGPTGATLHCDQLMLNHMINPVGKGRSIELEASGNTVVEGQSFTARAIRMTYAEAKDLLVFEGDGRNPAELFRQEQVGGPLGKVTAQRILFWPKTRRATVQGARSLDLDNVPGKAWDGLQR